MLGDQFTILKRPYRLSGFRGKAVPRRGVIMIERFNQNPSSPAGCVGQTLVDGRTQEPLSIFFLAIIAGLL